MTYNFHPNQIIRHKRDGKPYLVLQILKPYFLVVDLLDKNTPTPLSVIRKRDIKYFIPDYEMKCTEIWQRPYHLDYKLYWSVKPRVTV